MKRFNNFRLIACMLLSLSLVFSSCDDDDDDVIDDDPDNEIRFEGIALTSSAEVQTPPVTSSGTGGLSAVYNDDTNILNYSVQWTLGKLEDKTVGMHFHGPASVTENAGVIIPITLDNDSYAGTVSGQTRALTQDEEEDLLSGLWYLNVHSTTYPAGELRGQLE